MILFSTHTAYTQSMWCWLFMSGLRYVATTRPLQYTTLWRIPCTAMSVVLVGAMLENGWLLFTVHSSTSAMDEGQGSAVACTQQFNVTFYFLEDIFLRKGLVRKLIYCKFYLQKTFFVARSLN